MSQPSEPESIKNRPLEGIRVLITRPASSPDSLFTELQELGADVVRHPLIEFSEPPDLDGVREMESRLGEFSMLVFLSRRAAFAADKYFLGNAVIIPPIAAIGPGTWRCLKTRGYKVSFAPKESNSESMAEMLIEQFRADDCSKPILILRADRGSNVLPIALEQAGVPFKELAVYQSDDVTEADPVILQELSEGKFDWVTVTSSSIAFNAAKLFGSHLRNMKVASISPTTSRAATEAGLVVTAEATDFNASGLVDAILKHHMNS